MAIGKGWLPFYGIGGRDKNTDTKHIIEVLA